jgi:hypothetical protein
MAIRARAVAFVALVAILIGVTPARGQESSAVNIEVGASDGPPVDSRLIGFNWRAGGEAVAGLQPAFIRSFGVHLARVSPSPGVLDFAAPDGELNAIEATGARPIVVLIERPPWDPSAGSPGYEEVVGAVVRHYAVDRPTAGHRAAWFESGNEPEFPPTSHGQLPTEFAADVAAQVRAIATVESASRTAVTYGGPGALFADPLVAAAFIAAARTAGHLPDFISWHAYSNAPLLGPDGPEDRSNPAALAAWQLLHGTNPVASPSVLGIGIDVMRTATTAAVLPGEPQPALLITEWNLSSGGLDYRHDSSVGAAHTIGALIEMQQRGLDGATFFAAVDRHCSDPAVNPGRALYCGDWGTASADGRRKPTWYAFELWRTMAGRSRAVQGADAGAGLWALATHDPATATTRVLVASFSVTQPTARVLRIAVGAAGVDRAVRIRRIDDEHADAIATSATLPAGAAVVAVTLPANAAVLVEVGRVAVVSPPDALPRLPTTGATTAAGWAAVAGSAALLLRAIGRRRNGLRWPV